MTDGTSQGLFIVVAIVIFGIFTLMAYILFEDTLSPALASMFNDATEQPGITLAQSNEEDYTFDSTTGTITDYIGKSKYIEIPQFIGGILVEHIGQKAFHRKGLRYVTLPEGLKTIADLKDLEGAFEGNYLKEIILPDSLTYLGIDSFSSNRLERVVFSKNMTEIPNWAFTTNNLKIVEIPDNIKRVGTDAFRNNDIGEVHLNSDVTYYPSSFDSTTKIIVN